MSHYYKIDRGRTSTANTNSSVHLGLPHSKATQMPYNYALSQLDRQVSEGFVRIAQKEKVAKPDLPTLKQAMSGSEADEWKKAIQVEYDALISNSTWELVDCPSDQHFLTGK